jgi:DNA-binding response OmpR family regulator
MVVEDEQSLLELQSILFTSKGYAVTGLGDGQQALDAALRDRPDLVVLDVMLPGLDGFQVCRALKDHPHTCMVPVVILTGRKSSQDLERGRLAGADAYLTKPFKTVKLLEVVEGLLGAGSADRDGRTL